MLFSTFYKPHKLATDYNVSIEIEDRAGVLESEDEVYGAMSRFYLKTGISPSFVTVNYGDWKKHYVRLETYAYEKYLNMFTDEKHWLIVYSEPEENSDGFNDWYFEGMQGDETDSILSDELGNEFTTILYNHLCDTTHYPTVSNAVAAAFDEMTPKMMKMRVSFENLFVGLVVGLFTGVHSYFMVFFQEYMAK